MRAGLQNAFFDSLTDTLDATVELKLTLPRIVWTFYTPRAASGLSVAHTEYSIPSRESVEPYKLNILEQAECELGLAYTYPGRAIRDRERGKRLAADSNRGIEVVACYRRDHRAG